MRKTIIAATLSIAMLGAAGIAAFAQTNNPPANGMAGMAGTAADGTAMPMQGMAMMPMPMQGMMPMMQGMMPMMMGMMPMMMPMGGQPMAGMAGMAGMANTGGASQMVPAGLDAKLDLLIKNMDSLTARIDKLEAPAAN